MVASSLGCKERVGYLETVIIMGAIVTLCHMDWNALQSTVGGGCVQNSSLFRNDDTND